jgi:hypothetical protein
MMFYEGGIIGEHCLRFDEILGNCSYTFTHHLALAALRGKKISQALYIMYSFAPDELKAL